MKKCKNLLSIILSLATTVTALSSLTFNTNAAQISGIANGEQYNIVNAKTGLYMNVNSGTDANGIRLYQLTRDGTIEQKFKMEYRSSSDSYFMRAICSSNGTNRVIDVMKNQIGSTWQVQSGCEVDIFAVGTSDADAQEWKLIDAGDGKYRIVLKAYPNLCIIPQNYNSGTAKLAVTNYQTDGASAENKEKQCWRFKQVSPVNGTYYIKNKLSGKYLDTVNKTATSQQNIVQYSKHSGDSQKFKITLLNNGYYTIKPVGNNNACVEVYYGGSTHATVNGANIQLWNYHDGAGQQWMFKSNGNGTYRISTKGSAETRVMTVENASSTEGANVFQFTYNASQNDQWILEPATTDAYGQMGWSYVFDNSSTFCKISSGYQLPARPDHNAIDIISANSSVSIDNTPIKSPMSGRVCYIENNTGDAGNYIVIETNSYDHITNLKIKVGFMHMKYSTALTINQNISVGTIVGYVGTTGNSSGPHLDLTCMKNGSNWNSYSGTINPQKFFPYINFQGLVS